MAGSLERLKGYLEYDPIWSNLFDMILFFFSLKGRVEKTNLTN